MSGKNLPSVADVRDVILQRGWMVIEGVVDAPLLERMRSEIETAYLRCRDIQIKNGIPDNNEWTVHHLIGQGDSWMDFVAGFPFVEHLEALFDGKFILNSFGGSKNGPGTRSYAHNIHRDIRTHSGDTRLILNTLIMLDDFTPENGATWLMSGGQKVIEKPSEEEFAARAEQATGKAGSFLIFDSHLWHRAGVNQTDRHRRSVTPMFSRPFMKQQFDYPRVIGYQNQHKLTETAQQIIGFHSRVPSTLEAWYQPPEKRMYRPGQG